MGKKMKKPNARKDQTAKESTVGVAITPKILPVKKRNELAQLVDKLLRLTTASNEDRKLLEAHKEIDEVLKSIMLIETAVDGGDNTATKAAEKRSSVESIEKFTQWATENGAQFDHLSIVSYPGYELGIRCEKNVPEDSLVIAVPRSIMLRTEFANNHPVLKSLMSKDRMLQNMPNVTLSVLLLVEKFSNDSSMWKPYIDVLPATYSTVLYADYDDLVLLTGSPALEPALNLIKSIARQYAYFYKLVHTSQDPASRLLRKYFTYRQYR